MFFFKHFFTFWHNEVFQAHLVSPAPDLDLLTSPRTWFLVVGIGFRDQDMRVTKASLLIVTGVSSLLGHFGGEI